MTKASEKARKIIEQSETLAELRDELVWFAGKMEEQLRANDHKTGWVGMSHMNLLSLLDVQEEALWKAIRHQGSTEIIWRAVNLANYAMMIADNAQKEAMVHEKEAQRV